MPATTCPTHPYAATLRLFVLGQRSGETMDQVERHLGECGACTRVAEAVPGDRFVDLLRRLPSSAANAKSSVSSSGERGAQGPSQPVLLTWVIEDRGGRHRIEGPRAYPCSPD